MYPNWFAAWQVGSIAGIFLGSTVPAEWGLGFAGTLAILCMTVPLVANKSRPCAACWWPARCGAGGWPAVQAGPAAAAVLIGMLTAMAVEELTLEKPGRAKPCLSWEIWATIGVLAIATAATRSSFWLVGHHITIPKRVQEMLRYAPACALAAIIAP
jgi:hypothetical protein